MFKRDGKICYCYCMIKKVLYLVYMLIACASSSLFILHAVAASPLMVMTDNGLETFHFSLKIVIDFHFENSKYFHSHCWISRKTVFSSSSLVDFDCFLTKSLFDRLFQHFQLLNLILLPLKVKFKISNPISLLANSNNYVIA